jgi:beta-phosphoglucomutase-like phosphatase (HAD superfamily)
LSGPRQSSTSRERLQAVFFDFDGVIADSEPLHLRAYQTVLAADGIDLRKDDYYARYLGYDDVGLFRALAEDKGLALTAAKIDSWVEAKSHVIDEMLSSAAILFPGAADCVKMLAGHVPLAVASGALEPEIEKVLDGAGLRQYFAAIASASDGVRGKPAPDLYLLAMAKIRDRVAIDPAACIAIEDSHWGLAAAREAGLRCIAVTHTYPAAELGVADLIVDRLGDLTLSRIEELLRDNGVAR